MDDYLRSLGATCMRDTVCADDAKDIEQTFDTWKQEITSILSIYYPMNPTYSYPIGDTTGSKQDSKACCSEPKPQKSGSTCCSTHTNKATDNTNCCQNDTHTVTTDTKHSMATKSVLDDELEEQDIINNTFVTYDVPSSDDEGDEQESESDEEEEEEEEEEESDNLFTNLSTQNIGGCGEGNEADVDVEDLGAAISSHRVTEPTTTSTTSNTTPFIGPENDPKKRHKFPSNIPVHKGQKFVKKLLTPAAGTVPVLPGEPREMVTKLQRKALIKEGYRIIGSHSAVKLCRYTRVMHTVPAVRIPNHFIICYRWTKAQMRGRGGCYKHTFYGITSYQCMEATPSLACANKCVFCWYVLVTHSHTNTYHCRYYTSYAYLSTYIGAITRILSVPSGAGRPMSRTASSRTPSPYTGP